jgi:opacity protein-like surface antigen
MKRFMLFVLAAALMGSLAFAQTATPKVTKRQANQQHRIKEGVKSGELTKGEAAKLEAREGKIAVDKAKAKSDGVVTPAERAKLRREQNRASKKIYEKKHNEKEQH